MKVYAESSAVLSWLFNEARSDAVSDVLESATLVFASALTAIECARGVHRAAALGRITARQADGLLEEYRMLEAGWDRIEIAERVVRHASAPFPVEPIRALDAIHVASASAARERFADVAMLSFDDRVRANAAALGLTVLPNIA
ncbi:MAG: type II toxin-antitoxin system VapC family toxin [Gemmatimonadetes bacterium]|nr:type II toxin-antitoxin system VapC family toxin [Gemmatimonadota bacterium]